MDVKPAILQHRSLMQVDDKPTIRPCGSRSIVGERIGDFALVECGPSVRPTNIARSRSRRASTIEALLLICEQLASFGEGYI